MKSNDFLFTWKPDKWPYANLRALVDAFEAGRVVIESWRCGAHRMIQPGDRAYLYKQGASPRGIFAVAEVVGHAVKREDPKEDEGEYEVPLRFEALLDPNKRFLVAESDLRNLPVPRSRWNAMRSGMPLEAVAARIIDDISALERPMAAAAKLYSGDGDESFSSGKRERLGEVYERDQTLVDELKRL